MNKSIFGAVMASTLTFIVSAHAAETKPAEKMTPKTDAKVEMACQNNACKGKADCHGFGNASCGGHNECKGHGTVSAKDDAECVKKGGTWTAKK